MYIDLKKIYSFSILFLITNTYAQQIENCSYDSKSFKLLKKEGLKIDTLLVKTNGVYIHKDSVIDLQKQRRDRYTFCRFFKNGKVYFSCGYFNFPDKNDLNNLEYGHFGEYKVFENQIIIELYSSYAGYILELYKIDGIRIIRTHTAKRKNNPKFEKVFNPSEFVFYNCDLYPFQ